MNSASGIVAAVGAYILWGILPVYWKALQTVPAYEILCHRMSWSLLFTLMLIFFFKRLGSLKKIVADRSARRIYCCAAILLSGNWLLYIWAVNSGYVIEASLGYFVTPLVSVLLGMVFLKERLRKYQALSVLLAGCGVLYLTLYYGQFPLIAIGLSLSFGCYGLLHKKAPSPALDGLCVETMFLFIPATIFLIFIQFQGRGAFLHGEVSQSVLLFGTGVATSLPLLLFGYAARRISLTHLGLLQYIAPTISLLLGIFLYREPFPVSRMVGFLIIWSALLLFLAEAFTMQAHQRKRKNDPGSKVTD